MSILGTISSDDFLRDYWQQKPLLIRKASDAFNEVLTPDELAGLSCEEEIESRLIQRHGEDWELENGPIAESRYSELPEKNWTLLIQSVDQWLPEVAQVLEEFYFLPSWRLDDVMISYAAQGGSVGPHFDFYDVFLLQTRGRRKWRLGQRCDQKTELRAEVPLKQIKVFEQAEEYDLEPGDMLYIPAGVAHWGIALDDECMTWSIGFRAPSAPELLQAAVQRLSERLPEDLRYRDTPVSLKMPSGEICSSALDQFPEINGLLSGDQIRTALAEALGRLSTEPRYPEHLDYVDWSEEEVDDLFDQHAVLVPNHRCRMAFHVNEDEPEASWLFINGEQIEISTEFAETIVAKKADLQTFASPLGRELLRVLLFAGVYLVEF